jgi:hypothetical protein
MEKEFKEVVRILREAKRLKFIDDFALTGALALSALSQPRATRDIDFLVTIDKKNIGRFVEWLKFVKRYNLTKHHTGRRKDHIKDLIEMPLGNTWADLIVTPGDIEKEAIATALSVRAFKTSLKVIKPEFLIILKLIAGSEQDFIDAAQLWNGPLDKGLVRGMSKRLFLETKLKKMVGIAKKLP